MAASGFTVLLALGVGLVAVLYRPATVAGDFLSPLLSPIFDNVCKEVPCGMGSCKPSENSSIPFECVCKPGWKRPFSTGGLHFLPCVVPNCTINYSCSKTESPAPAPAPKNATGKPFFDPCSWDFCGGGTCNKSPSNSSSYSCSCGQGYANLMNSTSLPCFRSCELGGNCPKLGITLFNHSAAPAPAANANDTTNAARSLHAEMFSQVFIVAMVISVVSLASRF